MITLFLHRLKMKDDTHTYERDTYPDTWKPLRTVSAPIIEAFHVKLISRAVAAAELSQRHEKQQEESHDNGRGGDDEKRRDAEHRAYVEQRLKELAAFERRARGAVKRTN